MRYFVFIIGVFIVTIASAFFSSGVGSLVLFIIPHPTTGGIFASIVTGGVLYYLDRRWNITRQPPDIDIIEMDIKYHPSFGTFGQQ